MARSATVLMKGVWIGTLYKLLGNVDSNGCNNIVVPKIESTSTQLNSSRDELIQTYSRSLCQFDLTMLWHKRMGHIGEKSL
jgi:hypothetical protein